MICMIYDIIYDIYISFLDSSVGKESACHAGDTGNTGSIPEKIP